MAAQALTYVGSFNDLGQPTGLSLDSVGGVTYLYVSDHNGGRIFKIDVATGARTQIGYTGNADGQFRWPDAIAIEPVTHDLFIPDRMLHRITRITNTGTFVRKWGGDGPVTNRFGHAGAGTAPGQFDGPQGAVFDAAGNLYITEHENHRVQKFRLTSAGALEFVRMWGSGGGSPGQFNTPYGVTLDGAGNVWIADGFNSRLQKFTPDGQLLGQIGVRGPNEPHLVVTWATFDAAGDIYASITSDPNTGGVLTNQRIEKFSASGASLAKWGTYGSETGNFKLPFGSAIDRATNRIYIADWDNGRVQIFDLGGSAPTGRPPITTQPVSRAAAVGTTATFTANTSAAGASFQWHVNGQAIAGATSSTLTIPNVQPANAGVYTAIVTNAGGSTVTEPAVLAVSSSAKVLGNAREVGADIRHPNTNIYDQVLLEGSAATITADHGQVVRLSYRDLSEDIVQVEFSGAGALTIALDNPSGPAAAPNYNQPGVAYMRGHANIVITGANETTNLTIFTVGRETAVEQSLFRAGVNYDGWGDIAGVVILSANGKFGGLRLGNTGCSGSRGHVGIYAPAVEFTGPVVLNDITAADNAQPVLRFGAVGAAGVAIAGGSMAQANSRAVQVSGFARLQFAAGASSHGATVGAQTNAGRYEENGADVTSRVAP